GRRRGGRALLRARPDPEELRVERPPLLELEQERLLHAPPALPRHLPARDDARADLLVAREEVLVDRLARRRAREAAHTRHEQRLRVEPRLPPLARRELALDHDRRTRIGAGIFDEPRRLGAGRGELREEAAIPAQARPVARVVDAGRPSVLELEAPAVRLDLDHRVARRRDELAPEASRLLGGA